MEHYSKLLTFSFVVMLLAGCEKEDAKDATANEYSLDYNSALISGSSGSGSSGGTGGTGTQSAPGTLTAGEWSDLEEWDFWAGLLDKNEYVEYLDNWNLLPEVRYSVEILSSQGTPVTNACVQLKDATGQVLWETLTDNTGSAELWASFSNRDNLPLILESCSLVDHFMIAHPLTYDEGINHVQTGPAFLSSRMADIAFVVDATGSMGDELEYIKVELNDVIAKASYASGINPRVGALVYRDEGDEYVVRISPFADDLTVAEEFVQAQSAGGGGDFPEAVHTALQSAIHEFDWNASARARLLFLVLDAPPHYSPDVVKAISTLTKEAAQKGIKIIPVSASGISKETEFILRAMDIFTNGTYVFITDHSGIGNSHLDPTVGDYEVEFLNDLLIRLIAEYCK